MTLAAAFDVYGTPAPQGSKKAFNVNGRAIIKEAGGTHAIWRNQVAAAAHQLVKTDGITPLDGALTLTVTFRFPMPQSRPKQVRIHGEAHKTTAPDIDKLCRNLLDGLQAGALLCDDARIANLHASKIETTGWTGASIAIYREDDP